MKLKTILMLSIMVALFSQLVAKEPIIHPAISAFLLTAMMFWIGFQPREPRVIHTYMNGVFMRMFFLLGIGMPGSIIAWTFLSMIIFSFPLWISMIGFFLIIGILIFTLVYLLYWSLPFSRKKKGVPAVDAAIARYKKPNEDVAGAWEPDLIVDNKAYCLIAYLGGKGGQLAFDMQGNVIRDPELMRKISYCSQLAIQTARPDAINQRTANYTKTQTGMKQLEAGLKNYDRWVLPMAKLGKGSEAHIKT
jgi:hypothetical protein